MHESVLGSVLNVPAAKRGVLFAAVDVFQPLFRNGAEVDAMQRPGAGSEWKISKGSLFVSRCLAHLDELSALKAKGQLTAKNIMKVCFPDIPKPGRANLRALNDGRTAVLTMRLESPIMMGHADNEDEGFGQIRISQKLTIDLTPDVPVVTDVKVSQYINP